MKKQKIEDIFSSMEDFSSVPPPELWGQIEEKLNEPKKKKKVILWWSAAACLLLGLMLPSVLHFSSSSKQINTIHNNSLKNNTIVQDEKKNTPENNDLNKGISKENTITNQSTNNNQISSSEETTNQSNNYLNQNPETAAQTNSENNTSNGSFETKKNSKNSLNNSAVAEKSSDPAAKENSFNAVSKNPVSNDKKAGLNQAVAQKSFNQDKENNAFNSASKASLFGNKNGKLNPSVEKSFTPNKTNSFTTASKSQLADVERKKADKALAEKTFNGGKQNNFNNASKNQLSNSIFENVSSSKNNNNIAFTALNPALNGNQNTVNSNKEKQYITKTTTEKSIANVQKENVKNNSSFTNVNVLSKKDSAQLAELQNLEKGITTPAEDKKKKEDKLLSKNEKWALQLFAGVANSENYRNNKTLGNVNDSKQSNSYGVKTQYKINKKWAVASGFKINELGQSVANVSYFNVKSSALFTPVDYFAQSASMPQIASDADYVLVSNNAKESLKSDNVQSGNLDQNLRYLEMPLEVSYSIFSRNKTNINLNTGAFVGKLISNNVALDGNSIGENVNAKDYVYGSTLSSTIQYRVYKKTNVFVEPAVNYYVNPLNSQSFNQFQWGLNFGLNVNF
ncbi:hypothetical protein [Flavobacterium johnsoniae]|uniref:Outer membrane protein beta-barrel domain-containing protein n=1 Tax=Flavobacterium johnsoniae TaxID=986 RepID=A0A1J7CQV5_FLAJO|nr:hypothetical protein [Flavobacterium johnsoniae]OIV43948.1 hypothetical protein BKM63_01740 [Flavobacterium johnsoniae]